jgi:redox-sensitive bicupin YhaK (pirin superfamily)
MNTNNSTSPDERILKEVIQARPAHDGDGVRIKRIAGARLNPLIDPFLMLDEIRSDDAADYIGGFPEHPHRGMETITYMKVGRMRHRDHLGNEGVIGPGDVQWMTAGRGILHSEMPEQESGLLHGFQLWLNLPAAEKMKPAGYRDIPAAEMPRKQLQQGGTVSLIAGGIEFDDGAQLKGVLPELSTDPVLMDVQLQPKESVTLRFNVDFPAFVYVFQGGLIADELILKGQMGVFTQGQRLKLQAGNEGVSMLVLSGRPLNEPIEQYGPFVMNTRQQIEQAIMDFRSGRFI